MEAIGRTGRNEKIKIAIDVAATEFCIGTKYDFDFKNPNKSGQNFKSGEDMIELYKQLCSVKRDIYAEEECNNPHASSCGYTCSRECVPCIYAWTQSCTCLWCREVASWFAL